MNVRKNKLVQELKLKAINKSWGTKVLRSPWNLNGSVNDYLSIKSMVKLFCEELRDNLRACYWLPHFTLFVPSQFDDQFLEQKKGATQAIFCWRRL